MTRDQLANYTWPAALMGLGLSIFALGILSGPGRIDVIDGQVRYEVSRSLVEHGDVVIRDTRFWFLVYPGRHGQRYAMYRFPHSLLGVGAIWLADLSGPQSEGRRHWFFVAISAVAGAVLAVAYAIYFRERGHSHRSALLWAVGGFCLTPSWYYATSTFDEILGAASLVVTLVIATVTRQRNRMAGALLVGILLGWSLNIKPPMAIFGCMMLAAHLPSRWTWRQLVGDAALMSLGLALGIAVFLLFDWYKFPEGNTPELLAIKAKIRYPWPGNLSAGLAGLLVSPGAGIWWYFPAVMLTLVGIRTSPRDLRSGTALAGLAYFVCVSSISFFFGEPGWGPRYLTPLFALLWVFAPLGAQALSRPIVWLLVGLSLLIQISSLTVEPQRYFVRHAVPPTYGATNGCFYRAPCSMRWLLRFGEMVAVLHPNRPRSPEFSPAPEPTYTLPLWAEFPAHGMEGVQRFEVLNGPRPWWSSYWVLRPAERPIAIVPTLVLFLALLGSGIVLMLPAWTSRP